MSSASAISAAIRAKKKKMEEESGAVKLSGIPEDATDILVNKNKEYGEALSENEPAESDQEPSIDELMRADAEGASLDEVAPDPKECGECASGECSMHGGKVARFARIRSTLQRMGK